MRNWGMLGPRPSSPARSFRDPSWFLREVLLLGGLLLGGPSAAWADARAAESVSRGAGTQVLVVDTDDDDDDGVADGAQAVLRRAALRHLLWLDDEGNGEARVSSGGRLIGAQGRPVATDAPARGRFGLQALEAGWVTLTTESGPRRWPALELRALDAAGAPVDLARSRASLSRVLPAELAPAESDEDALSWLVIGPREHLPQELAVFSFAASGSLLDRAGPLPLTDARCPQGTPATLACRLSPPLRASTDPIDREHPAAAARSILAEVGGRIRVEVAPGRGASLRVGGPREFPVGRYRAVVRTRILRSAPGQPAVGMDDEGARALLRQELATASGLWGQCGIHFGPPNELDVEVVDVPPPHLVAVGCGAAQPARGGTIRLLVRGREIELSTRPGEAPATVAVRLAEALERADGELRAQVSVNAAVQRSAFRSADVLVRDRAGRFVPLSTPRGEPASTDPALPVCLGEVDLSDGLQHFNDFDAGAGTVEERALVKGLEDDDPTTIELIVVPSFGGNGRIGESFIFGPGASLQSAIILDRAGIRSGARSFTLAHELGHVLLDMPGHPDDFGVDTPSSLMDADASDPSIFGPRRLSRADCERALRQSGPSAPVPLLRPWPLFEGELDGPSQRSK